jgi:hypothetical protein
MYAQGCEIMNGFCIIMSVWWIMIGNSGYLRINRMTPHDSRLYIYVSTELT